MCGVQRVARYFFEVSAEAAFSGLLSVVLAARPFAFVALEVDLGQAFAICPSSPQNRQSFKSKHRLCSSTVSFPSLPNLSLIVSGFFELVPPEFNLPESPEFRVAVLEEEEGLFYFCL